MGHKGRMSCNNIRIQVGNHVTYSLYDEGKTPEKPQSSAFDHECSINKGKDEPDRRASLKSPSRKVSYGKDDHDKHRSYQMDTHFHFACADSTSSYKEKQQPAQPQSSYDRRSLSQEKGAQKDSRQHPKTYRGQKIKKPLIHRLVGIFEY